MITKFKIYENQNSNNLIQLLSGNDLAGFKKAIDDGADINYRNSYNQIPIVDAAYLEKSEFVKVLIDAGADVNQIDYTHKFTPLMWAVQNQDKKTIELLIDDVELDLNYTDSVGMSALMLSHNDINITQILIDAGADWNIKNYEGKDLFDLMDQMDRDYFSEEMRTDKIKEKYPDKYQKYLMVKKANEFNL